MSPVYEGISFPLELIVVEMDVWAGVRSVNIPWPKKGFGDGDYMFAFQHIVMPIAYEFAPELVISKHLPPHLTSHIFQLQLGSTY